MTKTATYPTASFKLQLHRTGATEQLATYLQSQGLSVWIQAGAICARREEALRVRKTLLPSGSAMTKDVSSIIFGGA